MFDTEYKRMLTYMFGVLADVLCASMTAMLLSWESMERDGDSVLFRS